MQGITLFAPPIAFAIVLVAALCLSWVLSRLAIKKSTPASGTKKPYACGEDLPTHMMQPNYSQFLPFAIFFTILHVVALMIATLPAATAASASLAIIYVLVAMLSMFVLYRS